jgi:peroxiredoxin
MEKRVQKIGEPVDDFSLQRVGGGMESLSRYMGRQGALVVFWSGICSHCGRYDEYFNKFTSRYPDLGFVCVGARQHETSEMIRVAIDTRKLTFPILHDPDAQIADLWSAMQTPRAYLLDTEYRVVYRGAIDNFRFPAEPEYVEYLEPALRSFLAGEPVPRAETPSFGCDIKSVYYILPKVL